MEMRNPDWVTYATDMHRTMQPPTLLFTGTASPLLPVSFRRIHSLAVISHGQQNHVLQDHRPEWLNSGVLGL